jgi:Mg2+/Co2+ transporter CorB
MGNQRIILIVLVIIAAIVFGAYKTGVFSKEEVPLAAAGDAGSRGSIPVSGLIAKPQVLENKITITG